MHRIRRVTKAALAAALFCDCVSVAEHRNLARQLAAEQARLDEQEKQIRGLKQAVAKQGHDLRNLKLERDELRERLAEAKRLVPAVADVARDAWSAAPEAGPVLAGTISFAAGSQHLSDADREKLRAIAQKIAGTSAGEHGGYSAILVEGHSDPTPLSAGSPFRSNMHLSTVRALAVYHALVEMPGIDAARVRVVGHGEFKPRRPEEIAGGPAPAAGKKPQRRVEVLYVPAVRKQ